MGYDAMASAPASIPRDLAKKKRVNRTAKLKQCKLDARREQWLSQLNKDAKASGSLTAVAPPPNPPLPQVKKTKLKKREEREQSSDSVFLHEMSDSDSPSQCASPHTSNNGRPVSSGSSVGSSSRSVSDPEEENHREEGEEENDVLDDWEAVADALDSPSNDQDTKFSSPTSILTEPPVCPVDSQVDSVSNKMTQPVRAAPRAWRPDDVFRPQSLPSISKQLSFSSMNHQYGVGDQKGILSLPSSCPICYEDLDPTDSSFLPCLCGFRLCLFCHKRILEADARCPGCRKKYENVPGGAPVEVNGSVNLLPMWTARLSRSCSVNSRY
ncbi:General negative regulator of transcription subunit 4 [Rhynchospora pubera]|uniref:General negative regulator of transcription subunit 4 n=1 Tax=Rhynchospora pubera TaxID=906938 RepID=A0AAV8G0W1_9POAL|nr:General negative regulator of transcription subunit 4 [Rhynchospora pubera]